MITTFEPRVENVQVGINDIDNNEIQLQVYYSIKNGLPNQAIEMTITRAR